MSERLSPEPETLEPKKKTLYLERSKYFPKISKISFFNLSTG
jgi:hypothetical protein